MEFRDARDMAAEVGAKLRTFDHTSPVAGCWIDRIEWLPRAATISERRSPTPSRRRTGRYAR
jgi:hypothetical protein